eukprot:g11430.t1
MSTTDSEAGAGGGSTADLQLPSEEVAAVGAEGDASFLEGCCSEGGTETETSTAPAAPSWLDPRTLIRNSMKNVGKGFDMLWKQYREKHKKTPKKMDDLARKEKKTRKEMKKRKLPADLADWSAKQNKSDEELAKQKLSIDEEITKLLGAAAPALFLTYVPQFVTESKNFKSGSKGRAWLVREVRKEWFAQLKPGQGLIDLTAAMFPALFIAKAMELVSICEPFDDDGNFDLTDDEDCASELKQDGAAPEEKSLQATVEEVLSETIGSSFLADDFKKLRKKMDEERKKEESQSGDDSSAKTTHES